jgi:hypothetical protein
MHAIPLRQNSSNVTVKSFFIRAVRTDNGWKYFNIADVENQVSDVPEKLIRINKLRPPIAAFSPAAFGPAEVLKIENPALGGAFQAVEGGFEPPRGGWR